MSEATLEERIRSSGYTPRAREVPELLELLAAADEDTARNAGRALARSGDTAARAARERFPSAAGTLRARLVDVVARVAADAPSPELAGWIGERAGDPDERVRRRAIIAAGKLGLAEAEATLVAQLRRSQKPAEQKALAMALGKMGGADALAALESVRTPDPELSRVVREATLLLGRRRVRAQGGRIRGDARLPEPVPVLLHVRAGLEEILIEELGSQAGARSRGRGRVELVSRGSLTELHRARTFLHLGFPLAPEPVRDGDVASAAARALASDAAFRILDALTDGPVRYRIDWADAGRCRSKTFRVAERVLELRPGLVNDATDAPWEAVLSVRPGPGGQRVFVELWPRAFEDPRFAYRKRAVPASSHPTIAAALARVASVVKEDVVWDPFVGAGLELAERALLGPYRALLGTDVDAAAVAAADENLRAAGITDHRLAVADATTHAPEPSPTLVITNPPYGQRNLRRDSIPALLERFLANASRRLARGGRLVWVSPVPGETVRAAARAGLRVDLRLDVDLGGPRGEIQRMKKA